MTRYLICIVLASLTLIGFAQSDVQKHGMVKVSADGRYLQHEDGKPFFWLGDTGWELFHRLTKEEIANYLHNRHQKGFNLVQAVVLAEFDGLRKPNRYGVVPFHNLNPDQPNEAYFELVDWTMKEAEKENLVVGLLPTWGDKVTQLWGEGPVVLNADNAYRYGKFLGNRYAQTKNIIWILGGDRPSMNDTADWRPIWRAMAKGILESTQNKALITYHTAGGPKSTSQEIHQEPWLHINMMQSGHGGGHDVPVWDWVTRDRALQPAKPTLDSEPNYEDHPVNPWPKWDPANGYFRDNDVRKQCYRSVFAGACGVTYGHHAIWQFWSAREEKINYADRYWPEAMDRPGATQVGYLRKLMESRDPLHRIPDQSIIVDGQGEKGQYATAFRDEKGRYGMVYIPFGKKVTINTSFIPNREVTLWWFDPRIGSAKKAGDFTSGKITLQTPSLGEGQDWVLVVDDKKLKFPSPGKK
ncbi:MAG: glycoside hydrolase family 140 protein [Chitinophagaceae bacterium]